MKPPFDKSGVFDCHTCDGDGCVSNGRGRGGNDPDSWSIPCEECDGEGITPCEVCGFKRRVRGYDCVVCETVYNASDDLAGLTAEDFAGPFGEALARAAESYVPAGVA